MWGLPFPLSCQQRVRRDIYKHEYSALDHHQDQQNAQHDKSESGQGSSTQYQINVEALTKLSATKSAPVEERDTCFPCHSLGQQRFTSTWM